jgi:hypothetical protein
VGKGQRQEYLLIMIGERDALRIQAEHAPATEVHAWLDNESTPFHADDGRV